VLLEWGTLMRAREGLGDGFTAFWAGEGFVEVFEDVAAGFAEEGVLVLPFCLSLRGFGHVEIVRVDWGWVRGVLRRKTPSVREARPPPPQGRGRGKLGA